jgi:hypothetical protein
MWVLVMALSAVLVLAGAANWAYMLYGERGIRARHGVPPHRGAATTLSGMAIGLGFGGLVTGVAALLPTNTKK